jgi:hypothetical protein
MIEAFGIILGRWCHQNNFPLDFKFTFKDISEPSKFVLTFSGIEIIKPSPKKQPTSLTASKESFLGPPLTAHD